MSPFLLAAVLALVAAAVSAWGPGNHLEFEHRTWRRRRERLPRATADLIEAHRDEWRYGHIAADIIHFKSVGGPKSHCHRWAIVDEMRALATASGEEAFALGYLAHLAADTIAHNHFVPYHLARYARTKGLGHLYWEMSADRFVPEERWRVVTVLKGRRELARMDELIHRCVPDKALSMGTNKALFNHLLLVSEREEYRRGIEALHPRRDVRLSKGFLELFREAAVERIFLALSPRGLRTLLEVDASGQQAQARAIGLRRGLARLAPGKLSQRDSEALAAPFLEGMGTPR